MLVGHPHQRLAPHRLCQKEERPLSTLAHDHNARDHPQRCHGHRTSRRRRVRHRQRVQRRRRGHGKVEHVCPGESGRRQPEDHLQVGQDHHPVCRNRPQF